MDRNKVIKKRKVKYKKKNKRTNKKETKVKPIKKNYTTIIIMSFIAPALSAAFILYDSITSKKEGYTFV